MGLRDRRKSLGLPLPLLLIVWWRQEEEATGRRAEQSPSCAEERRRQEEEEGGAPHAPWGEADTAKATAEASTASLSSGDAVQVEPVNPTAEGGGGGGRVQARNLQPRPPPRVTEASSTLIRFRNVQTSKVSLIASVRQVTPQRSTDSECSTRRCRI